MKRSTEKLIIALSLAAVIALFALFLKDILIPYVKLEIANDLDGAKELLVSKGVLGFLTVILVEALQMVVVFIPAEFIQISSGMSYPFYIAILLCDAGICLGATIIFLLVRALGFKGDRESKNEERIEKLAASSKKERSAVLLLYFLFIMPLIPFGAICYYGSRTKLKYGRYILTVATGVIPSIVTSNLMGAATKYFIARDLPLPLLILIIVLLAAVLFVCLILFLDKFYFKENDGTPDSPVYSAFFRIAGLLRGRRQRLHTDDGGVKELKGPFVVLCNHGSFYDFYYLKRLLKDANPAYVVNRHIISYPVIRKLAKKAGFISKRLFNVDFTAPRAIFRAVKEGYPVAVFPEGRLSLTGRAYPIVEKSAGFYKKLGVDILVARIEGAYFANPKWRKRFYRTDITVRAERIIKKEEAKALSEEELDRLIDSALYYDESETNEALFPQKDKAKGLENVLYRCIKCGGLYSTKGRGNSLVCESCGAEWHIDEHYRFTEAPGTIANYYDVIKKLELAELEKPDLGLGEIAVDTVIFSEKGRFRTKETGFCRLSKEGLSYRRDTDGFTIPLSMLPALPFSCNEEFEVYHEDRLYYFYPKENRRQVVRWALMVDLMEELKTENRQISQERTACNEKAE
ncbi:MAG: VTT domain-containing protein [Clostridiales bacterium]|nr:VTT domain-containing protein [Clostridiales bacterium]